MMLTLLIGAGTGAAMIGSTMTAARMMARACMAAVVVVVRRTSLCCWVEQELRLPSEEGNVWCGQKRVNVWRGGCAQDVDWNMGRIDAFIQGSGCKATLVTVRYTTDSFPLPIHGASTRGGPLDENRLRSHLRDARCMG